MPEYDAEGSSFTLNFVLQAGDQLINQIMQKIESAGKAQSTAMDRMRQAGSGIGRVGVSGNLPGSGGVSSLTQEIQKRLQEHSKKIESMMASASSVDDGAQKLLQMLDQFLGEQSNVERTISKTRSTAQKPIIQTPFGPSINPMARGFKFQVGGRGMANDVGLTVGTSSERQLEGGVLSREDLLALSNMGGRMRIGESVQPIAKGTSLATLQALMSMQAMGGAVSLKTVRNVPSEQLSKSEIEEEERIKARRGMRRSSITPSEGMDLTQFREYVELQRRLADATGTMQGHTKGIMDPASINQLGTSYQTVRRALDGQSGVVRLVERLSTSLNVVSQAIPQIATLGSQFRGMLDPIRQIDISLRSVVSSLNKIQGTRISAVDGVSGGVSPAVQTKIAPNLDPVMKQVASEITLLRTEIGALRQSINMPRGNVPGLRRSALMSSGLSSTGPYGPGMSGIQRQTLSASDPLLNPGYMFFKKTNREAESFNNQIDIATKRVTLYASAAAGVWGLVRAFTAGAKAISDTETQMAKLQFLMNGVRTDFKALGQDAFEISKTFGFSISSTLDAMVVFAQQGRSMKDTIHLVTASLAISNQTTMTATAATEALTAAMALYNIKAEDSMRIADAWANVVNKNAVSAEVLSAALKKAGGSAIAAGVDFDQLNAMITVINEATRKSGSEIGTSLKYVFKNLIAPETVGLLEKLGVAVFNANGNIRPTIEIFSELNDKMASFTDIQRRQVLVTIASARHYSDFNIVLRDMDKVFKVISQSQDSFGTSARNNAIVIDTLAKQWQNLKTTFAEVAVEIGSGGVLNATKLLVSGLKGIAAIGSLIPDSLKGIVTAGALFAGGISVIARAINGLTGLALPSVLEKMAAYRHSMIMNSVESTKYSQILLRESAAVETLANAYSRLNASVTTGVARYTAPTTRYSSIATPGGTPAVPTATTSPAATPVGFWNSGKGQASIVAASLIGSVVFGNLARSSRQKSNNSNTIGSTFFETMQGASTGALVGTAFGGAHGALVGGTIAGLASFLGAMKDYKSTLEVTYEINKKNLQIYRDQIQAIQQIQEEIQKTANVRVDPLTNRPVGASSVTISPIQSRLMVYETLAQMGQVGLKSSNEVLRQTVPGGVDAYGLAATRFSDSLYNVAKSNEELTKFIADLRETMENLKFETAKSALQLGKTKMEDLRAQADILRGSKSGLSGTLLPRFVHVVTGRVVGGATQAWGDTVNWAGSKVGAGGDNWLGNFARRRGQSAQSYANLMDKFKEIGDENIARIVVDMQILQDTNAQIQSYFDMYRTIVGKFENASKSATLTRGFYRSALSAAATPYSPEMRKAIEGIGEEDYTAMRKLHSTNPLAAREAESVAQAINQKFFNQFYNTRNLTGVTGNLDYQKNLIRNQGWSSAFDPLTQGGISSGLIVRELRVGDIVISGKRQEIITGMDDKSITSLGIQQDRYGLLNIEQRDGEMTIQRTREEYEKFIASLDESETVFARIGSSGRSFSGLTGDIEKDSNALTKVFGRLQEIFNKELSLIKRNLDYAAMGSQYNVPAQSLASAQAVSQLNTLLNRTGMTVSPLEMQSPTETLRQIGRTDLIAMLEQSSSSEDRLRESIDKLIEVTNKSLYDEIRSRAMTKTSLAENAVSILEKSAGDQKALAKFFAESNIPFTGQERDALMHQGKDATIRAARQRINAIPYDQAIGSGNLPGDLQAMSIQLSEAMRSGGIGAREALRRIKEAEAVLGISVTVARKRNLDIIRNQENIAFSRQNPDAISTESFGDIDLSSAVDFDPSKLQAHLENLQKISVTLSDFIANTENQKIAQQFDAIKKSIESFGTSLSDIEISLRVRNISDILTKQAEDLEMARRQFLALGESLYGLTDELGRRRSTSGLTSELSNRMKEQDPDLLRMAVRLPAQKTIGTAMAKAQENISLFAAKQNVFGIFRQDSDVTQSVVGEYKGMVDSLIAERQRLIRDGYDEEVGAIDDLIAKYKELNDKMEGQNRQLSPRRQQFLEMAAKDILSQGIPLIGINDEIRSVIGQNARLRQYGVETGSLMGVSTQEAQDLANDLEAQSDATMIRLRSMRDKIGESFQNTEIGTLALRFTGLEDLEEKLRQFQEQGVEIPVKFRIPDTDGLFSFREGKIVSFEKSSESLARGGKIKRNGLLARLHHGEVVIPSHLSGQLPEYITNQLGNVAPQGGILPMATGGRIQPEVNILFSSQFQKMLAKILPDHHAFLGIPEYLGESRYDLLHLAKSGSLQTNPYLYEVLTKSWHMLLRQRLQDLVEPREDYWRGTDNYHEQDLVRRGILTQSKHMNLGYREGGLSVWRGTHFLDSYDYRYGYGIAGKVVGVGADTEPLLSTKKSRFTTDVLTKQEIHDLVDTQYQQNLRRIQWHPLAYLGGIASPPIMGEDYRFLPIQAPRFLYTNNPKHLPSNMQQYADPSFPHDPAEYFDPNLRALYLRKRYSRLSSAARFSSPEDVFEYLSTRRLSTSHLGIPQPNAVGFAYGYYPKSAMFVDTNSPKSNPLSDIIHESTHLIEENMKELPAWNKILANKGISEDIVADFLLKENPERPPSASRISNFIKSLRSQSDRMLHQLGPLSDFLIQDPESAAQYYNNPGLAAPHGVDIMAHMIGNRRHPLLQEIVPTYFESLLRASSGQPIEMINGYFARPDRVFSQVGRIFEQYPGRFSDLRIWKQIVEQPDLRARLLDIQPTMSYRNFHSEYRRHMESLEAAKRTQKRYSRLSSAGISRAAERYADLSGIRDRLNPQQQNMIAFLEEFSQRSLSQPITPRQVITAAHASAFSQRRAAMTPDYIFNLLSRGVSKKIPQPTQSLIGVVDSMGDLNPLIENGLIRPEQLSAFMVQRMGSRIDDWMGGSRSTSLLEEVPQLIDIVRGKSEVVRQVFDDPKMKQGLPDFIEQLERARRQPQQQIQPLRGLGTTKFPFFQSLLGMDNYVLDSRQLDLLQRASGMTFGSSKSTQSLLTSILKAAHHKYTPALSKTQFHWLTWNNYNEATRENPTYHKYLLDTLMRYSRTSSATPVSGTPSELSRRILEARRGAAFGIANPDLPNIQLNPFLPGSSIDASGQITIGFTQEDPGISRSMEDLASRFKSRSITSQEYLEAVQQLALRHPLHNIFDTTQIPHELGHMAEEMTAREMAHPRKGRPFAVPAPSETIKRLARFLQRNYGGPADPNSMLINEVFSQRLMGLTPEQQIPIIADKENILRGRSRAGVIEAGEFWQHIASEVFTELLTGREQGGRFGRYRVDPSIFEPGSPILADILKSMQHSRLRPVVALAEHMRNPAGGHSLQARIFQSLLNRNNPLTEQALEGFLSPGPAAKPTLSQSIFEAMRGRRIIGTAAKHTGLALLGGVIGNAILGPAWAPTGAILGTTLPFMFGSGRQKAVQLRGSLWGGITKAFATGIKGSKGIYGRIRGGFQSTSSFLEDRKKALDDIVSRRRAVQEYTKQYSKTRFPDIDMRALRSGRGLPPTPTVFVERLRQQIELFNIIRSRPELADILPRPTLSTSIPNRIKQTRGILAVLSPTSTGTLSPVDVQRQILSNESVIRGIHERLVGADLVDWTIPRTFIGTPTASRFSRTAESLSRPRYGHLGGLGLNVFAMASPFLEAGAEDRSIAPEEVMSMGLMVGGIEAAQRIGGWASTSRMPWLRAGGRGIGAGMGTLFAGLSIAHAAEGVSDVAEGNENYWSALMKTAGRTSIAGGMAKGGAASLGAAGLLTPGLVGLALPLTTIALGSGALASSVRMKNVAKELEERQKRADLIRQRTIQGGSLRRSEKDKGWEWVPANAKTRWQKRLEDLALASGETNPANFELAGKQMLKKSYLGNIVDSKIRNRIFEDLTKDKDGRDLLFKALGIEHEQKTDSLGWFEMPFWGSDWKKRVQQENVSEILHKSGKSQQEIDEAVANIISASPEFGSLAAARMLHSGIKPRAMQQRIESRESYWLARGLRDFVAKGNNFMGQSISQQQLAEYLEILNEEREDYNLNKGYDNIQNVEAQFYELMSRIPIVPKGAPKRLYELQQRLIQNSLINYGTIPTQKMSDEQRRGSLPTPTRLINNPLSVLQANSDIYSQDLRKREKAREYLYNRWTTAAHRGGTTNSAMPYYGFGDMDMTAMDQYGRPLVIRTDEMIIPKSSISPSNEQSVLINNNKTINVKVGGGFQIINQGASDNEDVTRIIRENASEIAKKITDEIINKPIAIYS